jgi:hypothetical protein
MHFGGIFKAYNGLLHFLELNVFLEFFPEMKYTFSQLKRNI